MESQGLLDATDGGDIDRLQSRIDQCKQALAQLEKIFSDPASSCSGVEQWRTRIKDLREQNFKRQTIVGLIGVTGSGKSSLVNAILDEDRLVPTSCISACTSVVTEIHWNASDNPAERYSAVIDFISADEWKTELANLLGDLLSGSRINVGDEADLAWNKLRAVYPALIKSELPKQNVEELMLHQSIHKLFGKQIHISEATSGALHSKLRHFITGRSRKQPKRKYSEGFSNATTGHWPLIKVAKLYVKSDALSTGVVLVDLPGVDDSDTARAAVALQYMEQCDVVWIVSPVTRAINDKIAKSLLNQRIKLQVEMDDLYSHLTIVCSKTDDISVPEAVDQLGLTDQLQDALERADVLTREVRDLETELRSCNEQHENRADGNTKPLASEICKSGDDVEDELWAHPHSKKKKQRVAYHVDPDHLALVLYQPHRSENVNRPGTYLATNRLSMISSDDHELISHRDRSSLRKRTIDELQRDKKRQLDATNTYLSQVCTKARNEYSKKEIRADFADGLSEQYHAAAMEDEDQNVIPEREVTPRDYDSIAKHLPVFCVSSRAYQYLSGRYQHHPSCSGFEDKYQTEIPLLQSHCKSLTAANQAALRRRWLHKFDQLVDSLALWSRSTQTTVGRSQHGSERRLTWFRDHSHSLEDNIHVLLKHMKTRLSRTLQTSMSDRLNGAARVASAKALGIAIAWGVPPSQSTVQGWLRTYQAIARRNGAFSGRHGPRNFNEDLARPMWLYLKPHWVMTFQQRLPTIFEDFGDDVSHCLEAFHRAIETYFQGKVIHNSALRLLSRNIPIYKQDFQTLEGDLHDSIRGQQRQANRVLELEIRKQMKVAYEACAREHGDHGKFERMKQIMTQHITLKSDFIFEQAKRAVEKRIDVLHKTVCEQVESKVNVIISNIKEDYQTAFDGQHVTPSSSENEVTIEDLRVTVKHEIAKIRKAHIH